MPLASEDKSMIREIGRTMADKQQRTSDILAEIRDILKDRPERSGQAGEYRK